MKSTRLFSRFTPLLALSVVPALGGCVFIKAPAPEPTPTPVPTPYGWQFDPKEGSPEGTALNNKEGAIPNPALPDAFRAALIASGQELVLQSLSKTTDSKGAPKFILGAADTLNPVRLAGILVPTGSQVGAQDVISVIQTWIAGQDLSVDIDPVFPTDTDNKRRVQVFFTARTAPYTGQQMSLNRMLVRSGYAVVDLYSPTSFDQTQWLYDETFARENDLGLWETDTFRRLQQRVKLPSRGTGAKSSVSLQLPKPGDAPPPALVTPGSPGTAGAVNPSGAPGMPSSAMPPSSTAPSTTSSSGGG